MWRITKRYSRSIFNGTKSLTEAWPGVIGSFFYIQKFVEWLTVPGIAAPVAGLAAACSAAGFLSIIIGLGNMVPFIAGDGTMIVIELVGPTLGKWIMRLTVLMVVPMLAAAIVSDIVLLWRLVVPT